MRSRIPGEPIELVAMPHDPNPIPAGSKETIKSVWQRRIGPGDWLQLDMKWDNGRQSMLAVLPDKVVFLYSDVNE